MNTGTISTPAQKNLHSTIEKQRRQYEKYTTKESENSHPQSPLLPTKRIVQKGKLSMI